MGPGIEISQASSHRDLEVVRSLVRAFLAWHRQRHTQDLSLIDAYFDRSAIEAELSSLPGPYAPPHGRLLLATVGGAHAGCVALQPLQTGLCEMKRMFVYPEYRGRGVGAALAEAVITEAKSIGYSAIRLDTSIRQTEARRLYSRFGFTEIQPYYELSEDLRDWLVFMELQLYPQVGDG